jgi:hypothetical protein
MMNVQSSQGIDIVIICKHNDYKNITEIRVSCKSSSLILTQKLNVMGQLQAGSAPPRGAVMMTDCATFFYRSLRHYGVLVLMLAFNADFSYN